MPNRMLKDGLRTSGPINALSDQAFRLYVNLLLCADDFALLDWCYPWIKGQAGPLRAWNEKETLALMDEVASSGLVRCYTVETRTFAAIDKWEQRRNANKPKFPMPPWGTDHIIGGYVAPRARAPEPKASKANGAKAPAETVTLPPWLDSARWAEWLRIRPSKARTQASQRAALAKLEKFRAQGHDANAIVQESLANGWQGLFAPDERKNGKQGKKIHMCCSCDKEISETGSWTQTQWGPKHVGCPNPLAV